MKKPRELLYPHFISKDWHLDTIFTNIFNPDIYFNNEYLHYYIQSDVDESRYSKFGLKHDNPIVKQVNPYIEGFEDLGNNEKFVINKIMYGESPITVLVGTVGAGKSAICKFIQNKISKVRIGDKAKEPIQIYVDMNQNSDSVLMQSTDDERINDVWMEHLAIEIRYNISNTINLTAIEEMGTLWDAILEKKIGLGPELKKLVTELYLRRLDKWNEKENGGRDYEKILEGRMNLSSEINHNPQRSCKYLCELLGFIKDYYFEGKRNGVILYIDNIDQISPHAQMVIRASLLPLLNTANIRSIMMMRVSTWRMAKNDSFTFLVDYIPHTGPNPIKVILERLRVAKLINPIDLGVHYEDELGWEGQIDRIINAINSGNEVSDCISNICGHNIRKSLVVGQFLIASIEHPVEPNYLRGHYLKQILIAQGEPDSFEWSERNVVDNLFQVHSNGFATPMLKIRILFLLKYVSDAKPMFLGEFQQLLLQFGHDSNAVRYALNELMQPHKRIVWTDSVLSFKDDLDFLSAKQSKIFGSTVLDGYIKLLSDFDYMRVMVMDTKIPDLIISESIRSGNISVRLYIEIYLHFIKWLWMEDVKETLVFIEKGNTLKNYKTFFKLNDMISKSFLPDCLNKLERIIDVLQGPGLDKLRDSFLNVSYLVSIPLEQIINNFQIIEDEYGNQGIRRNEGHSSQIIKLEL